MYIVVNILNNTYNRIALVENPLLNNTAKVINGGQIKINKYPGQTFSEPLLPSVFPLNVFAKPSLNQLL